MSQTGQSAKEHVPGATRFHAWLCPRTHLVSMRATASGLAWPTPPTPQAKPHSEITAVCAHFHGPQRQLPGCAGTQPHGRPGQRTEGQTDAACRAAQSGRPNTAQLPPVYFLPEVLAALGTELEGRTAAVAPASSGSAVGPASPHATHTRALTSDHKLPATKCTSHVTSVP